LINSFFMKSRYTMPLEERRKRNAPTKPRKLVPPENLPLTGKQSRFVKEYVMSDGMSSQTECAISAGFGAKHATATASKLIRLPHVAKAIAIATRERDEKYGIKYERHLRTLAEIRDKALADESYAAAINAEYRRGQVGGLYINRTEVRHGSIDSMSKEDVLRALNEIRGTIIDGHSEEIHDSEKIGSKLLEVNKKPIEETTPPL